jgi:Serine carboxypeptidase
VADQCVERGVVVNETDVVHDVYGFLTNFYTIFGPAKDETTTTDWSRKQLYLFGESYTGMYVPSVAISRPPFDSRTAHFTGRSVGPVGVHFRAKQALKRTKQALGR